MSPPSDSNGWREYQRLVLDKLESLEEHGRALDEKVTKLRVEVAALKVKSGLWGALAGLLPAIGILLYTVLR